MKRIIFIAVALILLTGQSLLAGEKPISLEVSKISIDGKHVTLRSEKGESLYMEKGNTILPLLIEIHQGGHFASIFGLFPDRKKKITANFLNRDDFQAFGAFVRRTSDQAGACFGDDHCSVFVFF